MTSPDGVRADDPIRDVMQSLVPALDAPLDVIDNRADRLRRRFRLRIAAAVGALALGTVATAGALNGGSSHRSLRVEHDGHGRRSRVVATPTTSGRTPTNRADTNPTAPTTRPGVVSPPTAPEWTPGTAPGPSQVVVTIPTTPRTAPSSPKTTTTVPGPNYPPIIASHPRMTVVLDDTGLHAPAQFVASPTAEILFLDKRSHPPAITGEPQGTAYLFSADGLASLERWDGSQTELLSFELSIGPLVLHATDGSCQCLIPGATVTVTIVP